MFFDNVPHRSLLESDGHKVTWSSVSIGRFYFYENVFAFVERLLFEFSYRYIMQCVYLKVVVIFRLSRCPVRSFVRPSVHPSVRLSVRSSFRLVILLPRYLMNGLNRFCRTDMESILPPMTWLDSGGQRSKVKVTAVWGGEVIHVEAGTLKSI